MGEVVVLSPHPDDAVFSCWHALDPGATVVTVFAGVPQPGTPVAPWDRMTGATDAAARALERREEDRRAVGLAGCQSRQLSFLSSPYRDGEPLIGQAIAAEIPAGAHVFAPAGIGGDCDHLLVCAAALRLPNETSFYAECPQATEFGWPPWVTGANDDGLLDIDLHLRRWTGALADLGYGAEAVRLGERRRQAKVGAARLYRTQFAALEGGPQRRLTHPELTRYEVIWTRPKRPVP